MGGAVHASELDRSCQMRTADHPIKILFLIVVYFQLVKHTCYSAQMPTIGHMPFEALLSRLPLPDHSWRFALVLRRSAPGPDILARAVALG